MSAVQWWCSGVMLNTIFGKPGESSYSLYAPPMPHEAAGTNPPQSVSQDTGTVIDYTV